MPLLFEGKPFSEYLHLLKEATPKGKNKLVTFTLMNRAPVKRITETGGTTLSSGGVCPISTSCIAKINGVKGTLTYYESSGKAQGKFGLEDNYEPKYIHFRSDEMMIDAEKQPEKLVYMLLNRYNKSNANTMDVTPLYEMLDVTDGKAKTVSAGELKFKALSLIEEAKEKNKAKIRAIYEILGGRDFIELRKAKDWDSIYAPIYALADSDPKRLIEYMDSASLDVGAQVRAAIEAEVLKEDTQGFYWGSNNKKIWSIPAGKGEEGFELFVDFLRNQDKSGVLKTVQKEMEVKDMIEMVT